MTEHFILDYIPRRMKQLEYNKWEIRYRDLMLIGQSSMTIAAYNELWFIVDDPQGITVESDYGIYDTTGGYVFENSHQHKGEIVVANPDTDNRKVKFIQVTIVN